MGRAIRRNLRRVRTAAVINSVPDFLQQGSDGSLPDGFAVWRRGVTYTVRPEILVPLHRGQEFRINATVRWKVEKDREFTGYAELYDICAGILRARGTALTSSDEGEPLHTWTQWHAWWCGSIADKYPAAGDANVACASITIGLAYPNSGQPGPEGLKALDPADLLKPNPAESIPPQRADEMHIVFDFNNPSTAGSEITLSYGEYVSPDQEINFEPFVQRAERLAEFYGRRFFQEASTEIVKREWFRITDSNFVVVMVYFRTTA
jgi:hypothetical protein